MFNRSHRLVSSELRHVGSAYCRTDPNDRHHRSSHQTHMWGHSDLNLVKLVYIRHRMLMLFLHLLFLFQGTKKHLIMTTKWVKIIIIIICTFLIWVCCSFCDHRGCSLSGSFHQKHVSESHVLCFTGRERWCPVWKCGSTWKSCCCYYYYCSTALINNCSSSESQISSFLTCDQSFELKRLLYILNLLQFCRSFYPHLANSFDLMAHVLYTSASALSSTQQQQTALRYFPQ